MLLYIYKHNNNDYSEEIMKKKQSKICLFPAAMLGITATAGMIANIPGANADDNPAIDDTINITVDSSCTMGQTVTSAHTTELNPGETNTTIGQSRIAAYCNDSEGYAIYAIGYTNSEYGNTNLVSTDGNYTIPTGTSGSNSYWNMRLTQGTATGPISYLPTMVNEFTTNATIPNDYTKVAYRDSSTISQNQDPTETGSYFTTTYSAHIDTTQPAGIYTGQVQYVMVHPAGAPAPEKPVIINDLTYMQDFAGLSVSQKTSVEASMQSETNYTLKDQRDDQDYTIAKLKDGKIWMTKNLNLAGGTALSADTTDVDSSYISSFSTSNNLTKENNTIKLPASATAGFNSDNYSYVYNTGKNTSNCSSPGCYSYYSWDAATLGSGRGISTENTDAPYSICPKGWRLPTSGNSSNGEWKRGDFYALATAYWADLENDYYQSSSTFYNNAGPNTTVPNFLLAGSYLDGSFNGGGSGGYYWSSTSRGDSYGARYLYFTSSYVGSANNYTRRLGFSVRCLVAE